MLTSCFDLSLWNLDKKRRQNQELYVLTLIWHIGMQISNIRRIKKMIALPEEVRIFSFTNTISYQLYVIAWNIRFSAHYSDKQHTVLFLPDQGILSR